MALTEIRETVEIPQITLTGDFGIVQKKVNLKPMHLHKIMKMDIFEDTILESDSPEPVIIEWFLSPYPIIYSSNPLTPVYGNRGPSAGNDTVLMKAISIQDVRGGYGSIIQFPNQQVGATPTFSFYTPTVYITGIVHAVAAAVVSNIAFSFYIASDDVKAKPTTYGLGLIRERSIAQGLNLTQQGRTILPASNVGQIFPSWKFGGIRPERMVSATTNMNYFLNFGDNQAEGTYTSNLIRGNVRSSRQMVGFDAAFGRDSPTVGPVPDWIRFGVNRGLVSGPIRAQQPPRKLADNGNTLMF
tara:strand:+ start:2064 stop:2963 length:900 start_codon:yes stop_codon:yes gene_type:complete